MEDNLIKLVKKESQNIVMQDGSNYENDTGFLVVESVDRKLLKSKTDQTIYPFFGMVPGKMFYFTGSKKMSGKVYSAGRLFSVDKDIVFRINKIEFVEMEGEKPNQIEISKYGCWCEKKIPK